MATPVAALIVRVAADLSELKGGVGQINETLGGVGDSARKLGGVLAAVFSAVQVGAMVRDVSDLTGNLTDLAAKSGISAEAVQQLDFAAKQSGSSFETVATALAQMGRRLVGGADSTVAGLDALGLSLATLQGMAPDRAFETIAVAIAGVEDPMQRSKLAMELFGRAGADLLPVLTSDIGALRQKAIDAGLVMSNDLVRAGDAFGDNLTELKTKVQTMTSQAMVPLLQVFLELPSGLQTGVVALGTFAPALTGIGTAIIAAGGPMAMLAGLKTALMSLAFLLTMPAGAIVAAVVGLVAIWYKWDEIKVIAQAVYTAVKTWLVDRFQAVVDGIKAKIDAVTGFFKGMYDKVVGGSYVPDMIRGIASEFTKLQGVMVDPTRAATDGVSGIFGGMQDKLAGKLTSMFGGGGMMEKIVGGGLDMVFGPIAGLAQKLITAGMQKLGEVVWAGLQKIGGYFKDLFGGPSADELAGRDLVAAFESNMAGMMTAAQKVEAGTDSWKATVIVLRDAYLAMGLTGQEALADAARLWAASKLGAAESARVVEELRLKLAGGITVPVTFAVGDLDLPEIGATSGAGVEGFAGGSGGYRDFGAGTLAMLHGKEKVVPYGSEGPMVIHTTIELDGRVLARAIEKRQLSDLMDTSRLAFAR